MTPQRKTLLSVAAMLVCANAVALAVMNHKPAEALWIGGFVDEGPSSEFIDAGVLPMRAPLVELGRDGATLNGRAVPLTAMIDNMGRSAWTNGQRWCFEGCARHPWIARATVSDDVTMAVVTNAVRTVRSACNVEVIIFGGNGRDDTGAPMMWANIGDPALNAFSGIHRADPTIMTMREAETLEQFGERTGCARVSPLRP